MDSSKPYSNDDDRTAEDLSPEHRVADSPDANSVDQIAERPGGNKEGKKLVGTDRQLTKLSLLLGSLDEAGISGSSVQEGFLASQENKLVQVRLGLASSLYAAIRAKHSPTAKHCLRVALGCSSWMLFHDLTDQQRDEIEVSALLHDVGKIGVPDHVLMKPGKLTDEENQLIGRHNLLGCQILSCCSASNEILEIIHYASAHYDGGKREFDRTGEDLPLGSRMIAIVDAFDSMTTDHVYRRAMSRERAIVELLEYAGTQFDPKLVKEFCDLLAEGSVGLSPENARDWFKELEPDGANAFWKINKPAEMPDMFQDERLFQQKLFDCMYDGVIFVDVGLRILSWNAAAERLTGISGKSVKDKYWLPSLLQLRSEKNKPISDANCPLAYVIRTGVQTLRRLTIEGRGGERISINAHAAPVFDNDGVSRGASLIIHDASSQITLEERVQALAVKASRDPLTKVSNRAEFDRVHELFVDAFREKGLPCSLIICDLDHFKRINDTFGHQAGDEALVSFASLLRTYSRSGDLVARYGGEEFVLLCADCDNATATDRAERFRKDLNSIPQTMLNGKNISASFGVTEIQGGDTADTMLRRADRALLQAKSLGRNVVVQLGSGSKEEESAKRRYQWLSWFKQESINVLLEEKLISSTSIQISVEKLRGYVADQHAEIISIENNLLTMMIDGQYFSMLRRSHDRPMPFLIEMLFEEPAAQGNVSAGGEIAQCIINVKIYPKHQRDRRSQHVEERAKQLFLSLKSYLMAHEFADGNEAINQTREHFTVIGKFRNWFSPRRLFPPSDDR